MDELKKIIANALDRQIEEGKNDMDLIFMMKERLGLFAFLFAFLLLNALLLVAIWKVKVQLPKPLLVLLTMCCTLFIFATIGFIVSTLSFGYNS
ncbi:hypothetical protein [Exiguobacterium oxidotolerans]|uniref:hypothetical protein n=1 Tax=Exiguobacterium oxidotolerans TaxID=223958 RepID=UPI0004941CF5|nr:hypothetical protein [Exiguobacterium oxidotolerans]